MSEIEHAVKVIPIDAGLQDEVKRLEAEGWQLMPGVQPVAVYHVARVKGQQMAAQSGAGQVWIDDSKVHILRDGKLVN